MTRAGRSPAARAAIVATIVARLQAALVDGDSDHAAEISGLLTEMALSPDAESLFDELIAAALVTEVRGQRLSVAHLKRLANVVQAEIRRREGEAKDWEEAKTGTWQNLFFATGGSTLLGLSGFLTGTAVAIPPLAVAVLGPCTLAAFALRKRAHRKGREAADLAAGLQPLVDKINALPASASPEIGQRAGE